MSVLARLFFIGVFKDDIDLKFLNLPASKPFSSVPSTGQLLKRHVCLIIFTGSISLLVDFLSVLSTDFLKHVMKAVKEEKQDVSSTVLSILIKLLVVQIVVAFCQSHTECLMTKIGISCKQDLIIFIGNTVLHDETEMDSARISNAVTIDAQNVEHMFSTFHSIWSSPAHVLLALFKIWQDIGLYASIALGFIILYGVLQLVLIKMSLSFHQVF